MIFVTGMHAQVPIAGLSTYSATKAYLDFLAKALAYEQRNAMDVMTFQCGMIHTKMIDYPYPGLFNKFYTGMFKI